MSKLKSILIFSCLIHIGISSAQTLDIRIRNIDNKDGQLCIAVFENESSFKTEKPFIRSCLSKSDIVNGEYRIIIPIKSRGIYGVSVLDDKNKNGKMEYNFLGIPREGFGFSDFYLKSLRAPKFSDFCFYLEKNETKEVSVIMRYL